MGVQNTYDLNVHNPLNIGDKGRYAFSYLSYFGQEVLKESAFLYNPEEVGEFEKLLYGLERFDAVKTWKDILTDRFFDYKDYQPVSDRHNVFAGGKIADKNIDKFRCGQHSQVRCFGYREEELFYVLRIERDHSISDHG